MEKTRRKRWGRRLLLLLSTLAVFAAAWGIYQCCVHYQQELRRLEELLLRGGEPQAWQPGKPFIFDNTSLNINATLNPELLAGALRQLCPELAPDFAEFTRLETYDSDMQVYR